MLSQKNFFKKEPIECGLVYPVKLLIVTFRFGMTREPAKNIGKEVFTLLKVSIQAMPTQSHFTTDYINDFGDAFCKI